MVAPDPLAVSSAEDELPPRKERLAEAVPTALGANVTVKGTLWPAANVTGKERPAIVNAELLELAEDSVTLPPLAVTLPLCVWVLPIVMLPKFKAPGVTPSVPVVVVALPLRATVADESVAFDAMTRLAVSVPELVGAKVTDKFALAPGARA